MSLGEKGAYLEWGTLCYCRMEDYLCLPASYKDWKLLLILEKGTTTKIQRNGLSLSNHIPYFHFGFCKKLKHQYNQNLPSSSTVRNLKDDCFHFKLGYGSLLVSAYQLTVEVPSKQISITYTLKPITNHSIPVLFTEYHIVLYGWCLIEDML